MIRDYRKGDLELLKGNEFLRERTKWVKDFENRENYTIETKGNVMLIFSYKAYAKSRYTVYVEGSEGLGLKEMKEAKRLWLKGIETINPIRIETISIANEKNDRFHRFFGFELEGTKRNYLDDVDYNVWGWVDGISK